jgi:threonine/homoserine/homoserine lactone efflux protein
MTLAAILLFAGALFINSGAPGPSNAALVARVLHSGWRNLLPFLLAFWIGEALWLSAAIFGLAALAISFHYVFIVLKYAGIAYLLYLAYTVWTAPADTNGQTLPNSEDNWKMFATGMALTLGNPKIMVFYIALLPSLIDLASVSIGDWAMLVGIMLVILIVSDLASVAFASLARKFLQSPKAVRATNKISASMMTGAAGILAVRD